jgi:hypothetical protein
MRSSPALFPGRRRTTQDPAETAANIAAVDGLLGRPAYRFTTDTEASPNCAQPATIFPCANGKWEKGLTIYATWFRAVAGSRNAEQETIEITPATHARLNAISSDLVTIFPAAASNVRPTPIPRLLQQTPSIKRDGLAPMSWVWPDVQTLVPAADIAKVFSKFAGSGSEPAFDVDLQLVWTAPRAPLVERLAPRLAYLANLERGWDGYDAEAPCRRVTEQLLADLHEALADVSVAAPTLVPGADGSLQAEWRRKGYVVFYDMGSDCERTLVVKNKERGIHLRYEGKEALVELAACARDILT